VWGFSLLIGAFMFHPDILKSRLLLKLPSQSAFTLFTNVYDNVPRNRNNRGPIPSKRVESLDLDNQI